MDNYVIFHLHTMLSNGVTNIDSITNYQEYINQAKEWGMNAIAFSEHGSVFSWYKKKQAVEKAGMKYIHAIEAYITEDPDEKIRDNYHCVLIARNYDGFLEINKLSSKSFNRADVKTVGDSTQFYYAPRITFDELINTSDNVLISTACLASILNRGNDSLRERFICFLQKNKHRCFLEIQHHNVDDQREYNKYLYKLSQTIGVPLIAGTDTHALNDVHMKGREILQLSKNVKFADEEKWDLTMKSRQELESAYELQDALPRDVYMSAIDETNVMASMIEEFTIDCSYKYPHLWKDPMGTIRSKIQDGIRRRGVDKYPNYQEYLDRIEYEMTAYVHNEAIDFMLLMEDIVTWCREHEIYIGYGRGSVNGSVIAWILGITEMDSIKYKLNFERFMNIQRVSLSDIDSDIPPSKIDDVKKYIYTKKGLHCSDIITFNTIADKGAIKDVARALQIPLEEAQMIADSVDNETEYIRNREKYKKLFEYVDLVKGVVVSIGSHPCGTIVCGDTLEDHIALCTTSTSAYPISQLYMKEVDSINYVKLDLLKLDTIELINETCKLANIERLTPDNVDLNDIKVWNAIRDDTTQIFQWEGNTGNDYIKKLLSDENIKKFQSVNENLDRLTLLSIGNSAIRPAGASYREDLARGVVRTTGSRPIDDFLSNTFGYLVFQCQIIDFLHLYCGFTMGEADIVRRGFAKKTGTEQYIPIIKNGGYLNDKKEHYIDGFIKTMKDKYNISEDKSEKDIVAFIKVIEDASAYLFSLNHSAPYSVEGYVSGYLRTYYPLEFLTVALNINKDKEEKTLALTQYAKKVGIQIKSPKYGFSKSEYSCDKATNTIYKGLASIKYINSQIPEELYELSQNNSYDDFVDLLYDIKEKTSANSRMVDILIRIDFFSDFGDINKLMAITIVFNERYDKSSIKKDVINARPYLTEEIVRKHSASETETHIDEIDLPTFMAYRGLTEEDLTKCIKYRYIKKEDGSRERVPNGISFTKLFKEFSVTDEEKMKFGTKIVYGKFDGVDVRGLLKEIWAEADIRPCSISKKIAFQQELLGYVDYVNPDLDARYFIVSNLNTKYSPRFMAYCLKNGNSCEMRVKKRRNPKNRGEKTKTAYSDKPFGNGDILYLKDWGKEPKSVKTNDGWAKDYSTMCNWMYDYDIVNI